MTSSGKNIRVFIIDDEEPARNIIRNFLKDEMDIIIEKEYSEGFSAVKGIDELKPDLIFLDIQMPKLSGFEVLELLDYKPAIIFTTAFDQYAIKAFEFNTVDYLLKPFSKERFQQALERAKENLKTDTNLSHNYNSMINTVDEKPEIFLRIAIKYGQSINIIPVNEIIYIEAYGDYVKVHTKEHVWLKEKTMKYFEDHFDTSQFVRIHRSFIVNVNEISGIEYYDKETHIILLKNKEKIRASITGYQALKKMLNL